MVDSSASDTCCDEDNTRVAAGVVVCSVLFPADRKVCWFQLQQGIVVSVLGEGLFVIGVCEACLSGVSWALYVPDLGG